MKIGLAPITFSSPNVWHKNIVIVPVGTKMPPRGPGILIRISGNLQRRCVVWLPQGARPMDLLSSFIHSQYPCRRADPGRMILRGESPIRSGARSWLPFPWRGWNPDFPSSVLPPISRSLLRWKLYLMWLVLNSVGLLVSVGDLADLPPSRKGLWSLGKTNQETGAPLCSTHIQFPQSYNPLPWIPK